MGSLQGAEEPWTREPETPVAGVSAAASSLSSGYHLSHILGSHVFLGAHYFVIQEG